MPAFFKCKSCGQEHLSPLFFPDEKSFTQGQFGEITLTCPTMRRTAAYEKKDLFWRREEGEIRHQPH